MTVKRHKEPWDEREIERLRQLLQTGLTMRAVSRELGRTEEATRARALKAKLLSPRPRRSGLGDGPESE